MVVKCSKTMPAGDSLQGTYTLTVKLTAADIERLQIELQEYADTVTPRTVAAFLKDTLQGQLRDDLEGWGGR